MHSEGNFLAGMCHRWFGLAARHPEDALIADAPAGVPVRGVMVGMKQQGPRGEGSNSLRLKRLRGGERARRRRRRQWQRTHQSAHAWPARSAMVSRLSRAAREGCGMVHTGGRAEG